MKMNGKCIKKLYKYEYMYEVKCFGLSTRVVP